jgi:hypothetical protein
MHRSSGALLVILAVVPCCLSACDEEPPPLPPVPPAAPAVPTRPSLVAEASCKPPHGGRLLALPDGRGHAEWVVDSGRLYLLDNACRAAAGATNVILTEQSPQGPRQVALTDCGDKDYPDSCWTSNGGELRKAASGVIRFNLNGEPVRVPLKPPPQAELSTHMPVPVPSATRATP